MESLEYAASAPGLCENRPQGVVPARGTGA